MNNAFLNGELVEDVFIIQPLGFEKCDEARNVLVCTLNKTLYGLKEIGSNSLSVSSLILYVSMFLCLIVVSLLRSLLQVLFLF